MKHSQMGRISIESAKTVLEVAELAFKTVDNDVKKPASELEGLMIENEKLRALLQENVKRLQNISESPCLLQDCPPDLHTRIMDTVESPKFLNHLKTLHKDSVDGIPGLDLHVDEILINVGREEPSSWIWVSDEMLHESIEEKSGIDNDNYVVISQEQVVDAIGNFMARCALLNPKAANMTPEEMQKRLTKAFRCMSKFEKLMELWQTGQLFYLMTTWGLTLAGLYECRALLIDVAKRVHFNGKAVIICPPRRRKLGNLFMFPWAYRQRRSHEFLLEGVRNFFGLW